MALAAFAVDQLVGTNLSTIYSGVTDNTVTFVSIDDYVSPSNAGSYPVPVPDSVDYSYSYENVIRLRCITAPNNTVSGIKIYGPNINPASGVYVYLGAFSGVFTPTNTGLVYAQTRQDTNYYDPDSNYLQLTISGSSSNIIDTIGEKTDFLIAQLEVRPEASGNTSDLQLVTLNVEYDET